MADDYDDGSILHVLKVKLPFFVIGIGIGMLVVWISLLWLPGEMAEAVRIFNRGVDQ